MSRDCDICGARTARLIYRQRFARFDDHSAFDGYDVVACDRCGFVYADGIPAQAAFDRYYREMSKYESHALAGEVSPTAAANYRAIATEIAQHLPDRNTRILDVGCASGHLLAEFKRAGYDNVLGLDPSPRCSEIARERYGIEVVNTPLSAMRFDGRQFDLVLLSSVLEHLPDVVAAVRELVGLLAPGGSIWFEVPDASRFAEYVEAPFQQFSLEHINFFTQASLVRLMARVGYRPSALWTAERQLGSILDPALDALFVAGAPAEDASSQVDVQGPAAVTKYVEACAAVERDIYSRIEGIVESATPVVVWGTGSLALHLLADERFRSLHVTAFADSNQNYQGKTIAGIPIVAPEALAGRAETIVVVSRVYEAEIIASIRERYGLTQPVVGLFGTVPVVQ